MIVLLVYRPEAMDGPHQSSRQDDYDPFNGVEVYGIYLPAERKYVEEMIGKLCAEHPKWHFHITEQEYKLKVGFNV
jgi:hypothetical protein